MQKKKLLVINYACYRDTDCSMIKQLEKDYDVSWYIISMMDSYVKDEEYEYILDEKSVNIEIFHMKWKKKSIDHFSFIYKLLKRIRNEKYDFILTGINEDLFFSTLSIIYLRQTNNIVLSIHDVEQHPGIDMFNKYYNELSRWIAYKHFSKFQVFTKSQYDKFQELGLSKSCLLYPMPLKFLGRPTCSKRQYDGSVLKLLFFGGISYYKGIETYIEACKNLRRSGYNIEANIIGNSSYDEWRKLTLGEDWLKMDIRSVQDTEIPNIYYSYDFIVLPYRQVTQSGPLLLAYNYNLPVIASNVGSFTDMVVNGVTGYLFDGTVSGLEKLIVQILKNNTSEYTILKNKMEAYVNDKYRNKNDVQKLIDYFELCV